ncbi:HET-domain-containing protein, partial [Zopfia rhizophila CBS 207.26]
RSWIHDCTNTHKCDSPAPDTALPSRVLDVLVSDSVVALVESRGRRGRYIALSHSWGRSPRMMAKKSTLGELKGGIAISALPKTFRDAIRVTRALGIRHLWIDCLCIIQDDPSDWEKESAAMGELYLNAYLTIAASNSSDSNSGCFPERCMYPGWTLQERLLPSRIVHYCRDQMYFECKAKIQSEDGFSFTNIFFSLETLVRTQMIRHRDHGRPPNYLNFSFRTLPDIKRGVRWNGGWLSLVENYSQRELTVAQDKLSAIAGIARILGERTQDRYFAGLWAAHFYEDLCWRVYAQDENYSGTTPVKGKILGKAVRPSDYRAPSWSWASLDAPIRFVAMAYSLLVARVVKCEITPSGMDPYGKVKGGRLVIEVSS